MSFAVYSLYFAVCAAFLVNAAFLAVELFSRVALAGFKKSFCAALFFAAAFFAAQYFYGGLQPRGGYDNDHDFQYLSADFLRLKAAGIIVAAKEASPPAFDAVARLAGAESLASVPVRNRLLMFLSSALLFFCLRVSGAGLSAACFGFVLFYFNFLTALNGNSFSTTAGNILLLVSALCAAAVFEKDRRDAKGLLWAVSALFLVWTGRYELAALPGLLLFFSLISPDGALRALAAGPGTRCRAALILGSGAVFAAAWAAFTLSRTGYNGPPFTEAAMLLPHLAYQLGEGNLGAFLPAASVLAPCLAAGAFILVFRAGRPRSGLLSWPVLLGWILFSSAIFMLRDNYPLQFMRHRLYFFVPFVFLFSAAWEVLFERHGRAAWAALAAFCVPYIWLNAGAARALEPERRTNDMEWALLLEAEKNWPAGCVLALPEQDRHHRRALLEKYFPVMPGGGAAPGCVMEYRSPARRVFDDWTAAPSENGGKPFLEASFAHRFYTGWPSESKEAVPLRGGFYYAGGQGKGQ